MHSENSLMQTLWILSYILYDGGILLHPTPTVSDDWAGGNGVNPWLQLRPYLKLELEVSTMAFSLPLFIPDGS